MIRKARAAGPVVLVDAGDALYAHPELGIPPAEVARARLLLEGMGAMGYAAMAVGDRDLGHGLAELKRMAADTGVPLLAANLIDAQGQHPFPGTRLVDTEAGKVGIFAVTALYGAAKAELKAEDPVEAARAAIQSLRQQGATTVIGLLHLTSIQATDVINHLPGLDLAVVAHEGQNRVVSTTPPAYTAGNKGRDLAKITLEVGAGPVHDTSEHEAALNEVKVIENTTKILEQRGKTATTPEAKKQVQTSLDNLKARREAALAKANAPVQGRSSKQELVSLDSKIDDDPVWAKKVAEEITRDGHTPGH